MNSGWFDSESFHAALRLLADGNFHSGEQLGALLGVSRAAVWKTLKKFELLGIKVLSVKGKGYCIEGGVDLLDKVNIQTQYSDNLDINIFTQLDSTNSYLLRQKKPENQVCLAEIQTAGRGRRGRNWISPFAQNLYLSIAWKFDGGLAAMEGLSLAIGVGIVRALGLHGVNGLNLKWPNDLLYKGKKLGGVLIEISGDPLGDCLCVVGIGINVSMDKEASGSIGQPWINLNEILTEQTIPLISRNQLASSLLDQLILILSTYQRDGFELYRNEWLMAAAYLNQEVNVLAGKEIQTGILRGIDGLGALQVSIGGVEQSFHGGEISLRGAHVP